MADPVGIVEIIIDIAITIKDAVETVRKNKDECRGIEKLVRRVSDLLSLLKGSVMMRHPAVGGPLEDLRCAVSRAREVVTACQGKNMVCLFCKAGKLAKKLTQVKNDISHGMMLALFATHVTIFVATTDGQECPPDLFFLRKYLPPPLSENLPALSSPAVVEDRLHSLPTNEPTSPSPTTTVGKDQTLPRAPPYRATDIAEASDLEPRSQVHMSSHPPLPSASQNMDVTPMSKPPSHPPPQPPPPPSPPRRIAHPSPTPPPPHPPPPLPTKRKSRHSTTEHTPSSPPHPFHHPPPAKISPSSSTRQESSPHPPTDLLPSPPSQSAIGISTTTSDPVSLTPSAKDASSKSDEINVKQEKTETHSHPFPGLQKFSLSELEDATSNFSNAKKIGSSDFCVLYKGKLRNRLVVAIKEFQDPPRFLEARLYADLLLVSEIQSKVDSLSSTTRKQLLTTGTSMDDKSVSGGCTNIIRVIGYGHELMKKNRHIEHHIFVVEEYMPNGNMGKIIYGSPLHWSSRFRIILGLAQGLHYLHEQNIVHMNVKPANILLDFAMNPKISDFGIAKRLNKPVIHDDNITGTVGYMPPEYILEGIVSTKHDVYSFGIIVLETISGMSKAEPAQHHVSITWAWNVRQCQQMGELFDPSLFEESQLAEIRRCLEVGMLCTQYERAERPTMVNVLEMLNGNKEVPIPKQPEYTKERSTAAAKGGGSRMVRSRR